MFAGVIPGIEVFHLGVPAGRQARIRPAKGKGRVLLFLSGTGTVESGPWRQEIRELALLVPHKAQSLLLQAVTSLDVLELTLAFTDEDERDYRRFSARYPFFQPYSQCTTYREAIKSPQTVNRTLLPEDTFPRVCIGSVETAGPDTVGQHKHPMLEQLFVGLADNRCVVNADGAEAAFGEHEVLHIPLGSNHGVRVDAGNKLHYIWIDVFANREGFAWITQQHVANPPTGDVATPPQGEAKR